MMNTVTAIVDEETAMTAVMMTLSKAIVYGDKFDYDYTDGVLTMNYEPSTPRKAWVNGGWV